MLECLIAADDITYGSILNGGPIERRPRVGMVVHPISDGYVALQTAGAPHLWARLVTLIGKPELATDPRFATPGARRENWPALLEIYRVWLSSYRSVEKAVEALTAARIPAVPMLSPEEIIEHPHLKARQAFPEVAHPTQKPPCLTATPFFVDGKPTHPTCPPPYRVGQHTHDVLAEFGYGLDEIDELQNNGVIP